MTMGGEEADIGKVGSTLRKGDPLRKRGFYVVSRLSNVRPTNT